MLCYAMLCYAIYAGKMGLWVATLLTMPLQLYRPLQASHRIA